MPLFLRVCVILCASRRGECSSPPSPVCFPVYRRCSNRLVAFFPFRRRRVLDVPRPRQLTECLPHQRCRSDCPVQFIISEDKRSHLEAWPPLITCKKPRTCWPNCQFRLTCVNPKSYLESYVRYHKMNNAVLCGCWPCPGGALKTFLFEYALASLYHCTARLVSDTRRSEHITPVLRQLH